MTALQSLRPAASGVARNPLLIVITALFGLSQLPNMFLQPTRPLLAAGVSLLSTGVLIFALPFFQGGLLAMASEAIRGQTSLETLIVEGKAQYVSLLLAYFVLLAINLTFAFLVVFAVFFGVVGASVSGLPAGDSWTLLAVIAIVGGGLTVVYLLITLTIQFYAHAIVLDGTELVDGFRRSVGVVRSNLLSVFGYSLVLLIGGLLLGTVGAIGGIVSAAWGATSPAVPASPLADFVMRIEPTTAVVAGVGVLYVAATGLFGALYATYSVAFYESIRPAVDTATADTATADTEAPSDGGSGPTRQR